jgi:hypothetical protein
MGLCSSKADPSITSRGVSFFDDANGAIPVDEGDYDEDTAKVTGNVYLVIAGSNYEHPACTGIGWGPIDQYKSAKFVSGLRGYCENVTDYVEVFQQDMTRENMFNAIEQMASQTGADDTFVLFYAGHGDQLEDQDGDEQVDTADGGTYTGKDQAMVLINPESNNPEPRTGDIWFRDDDLVELITSNCAPGAKILACLDCCHSGGMLDCENPKWKPFRCVSISGCASKQVSKGRGQGSYFSHSLSAAFEQLQGGEQDWDACGEMSWMTSQVYNAMVDQFNSRYSNKSEQKLTIRYQGIEPSQFPWPLVPKCSVGAEGNYTSQHGINYAAPV